MKTSVIIVTYRRAWSLRYCLESLTKQTLKPDEIVIVLKPSGDGSEKIIHEYMSILPIKLVIQHEGYAPKAYDLGIKNSSNDIILFIDDDAIAHEEWVERYVKLFNMINDAGGIGGLSYKAYLDSSKLYLTNETYDIRAAPKGQFYRKPLKDYDGYCAWLSKSGFMGSKICEGEYIKSVDIGGANMAFKREAIEDCPLGSLYRRSRKAFMFEQFLAHCARQKGFHLYKVYSERLSPIIYHIEHKDSLSRKSGFKSEFWLHYDRTSMYWRLRKLGADVSTLHYLIALIFMLRIKTIPRFLATIYALLVNTIQGSG